MTTGGIHLFQILRAKMGEREAGALVDYVDSSLKENKKEILETNLRTLATKEDLAKTKEELKSDIAKLDVRIGDVKSDVTRWMFAIFVTMTLAILGLYFRH